MTEQDGIKHVYTGSNLEAKYILELLEENGISGMLRNTLRESVIAGWASGAPDDAGLIFVTDHEYDQAKKIIDAYLSSLEKE